MVVELSVRHIEQNDEKLRANLQTTIERGMVVKNKEMKVKKVHRTLVPAFMGCHTRT